MLRQELRGRVQEQSGRRVCRFALRSDHIGDARGGGCDSEDSKRAEAPLLGVHAALDG